LAHLVSSGRTAATSSGLLYDLLGAVYDWLGFDVVADPVFRDLVIARIVEPTSKLDSLRGQLIDTVTPKHGNTKVNNTALRAEPVWDPQAHPGAWRAIWSYSAKRAPPRPERFARPRPTSMPGPCSTACATPSKHT
jgi:hypothetical protein